MNWHEYTQNIARLLNGTTATAAKSEIPIDHAFELWQQQTKTIRQSRNTVFLVGNGASASMASHFAADLAKNGQMHTETFTDLSLITAISNDLSYEEVFSEPLKRRAKSGDMLIAISSSGNSPNIVRAISTGLELGMKTVTLTGMSGENGARTLGELNFYVNDTDYGNVETSHAAILHFWMDGVCIPAEQL